MEKEGTNEIIKAYLLKCIDFVLSSLCALGIIALVFYPYDLSKAGGTNTISILLIVMGILFVITAFFIVVAKFVRNRHETNQVVAEDEEIAKERAQKREAKQKK